MIESLEGLHVVLTRSIEFGNELVKKIEAAGAEVKAIPVIQFSQTEEMAQAIKEASSQIKNYDWCVFTSATAVKYFGDTSALNDCFVAAVGEVTEKVLNSAGVKADLVPGNVSAQGLAYEFPSGSGSVLFPCAIDASNTIEMGLSAKGWQVDRIEVYKTEPVALLAEQVNQIKSCSAVILTSPSGVTSLAGQLDVSYWPPAIAIGTTTKKALQDLGVSDISELHKLI